MDDLISRQAAIKALADYIHNVDKVYSTGKLSAYDCKDAAKSVLDGLPSAQPEPSQVARDIATIIENEKDMMVIERNAQPERKKGKWIAQKGGGYCCLECGSYSLDKVDGAFVHVSVRTRYCHNCGVKMEESDE